MNRQSRKATIIFLILIFLPVFIQSASFSAEGSGKSINEAELNAYHNLDSYLGGVETSTTSTLDSSGVYTSLSSTNVSGKLIGIETTNSTWNNGIWKVSVTIDESAIPLYLDELKNISDDISTCRTITLNATSFNEKKEAYNRLLFLIKSFNELKNTAVMLGAEQAYIPTLSSEITYDTVFHEYMAEIKRESSRLEWDKMTSLKSQIDAIEQEIEKLEKDRKHAEIAKEEAARKAELQQKARIAEEVRNASNKLKEQQNHSDNSSELQDKCLNAAEALFSWKNTYLEMLKEEVYKSASDYLNEKKAFDAMPYHPTDMEDGKPLPDAVLLREKLISDMQIDIQNKLDSRINQIHAGMGNDFLALLDNFETITTTLVQQKYVLNINDFNNTSVTYSGKDCCWYISLNSQLFSFEICLPFETVTGEKPYIFSPADYGNKDAVEKKLYYQRTWDWYDAFLKANAYQLEVYYQFKTAYDYSSLQPYPYCVKIIINDRPIQVNSLYKINIHSSLNLPCSILKLTDRSIIDLTYTLKYRINTNNISYKIN